MITKRKLQFSSTIGGMVLFAVLTALIVGSAASGATYAQGAKKCSLKTIQGTYIFEARGVIKDGEKTLPWAEAGVWTLDGAGKAVGTFSASVDGVAIARQKPLTATYELTTGCVFRAIDSEAIIFDLYPTDQGTMMTYFSEGVSGTMFKR